MKYHQITSEERYTIATLRQQGFNQSRIAAALGRHRSSISREIRRNRSEFDRCYRPFVASHTARARRWRSRRNTQFCAADFRPVETLLKEKWSPEQIVGRFRLEGKPSMSQENEVPSVGDIFFLLSFRDQVESVTVWTRCFLTRMLDIEGQGLAWVHAERERKECSKRARKKSNNKAGQD